METIKEWWHKKCESRKYSHAKALMNKACEMYQIEEYMGKVWLTYNGALICPRELFSKDIIEVLNEIRAMYAARES